MTPIKLIWPKFFSVNHIKYLEPLKHCEKLEELYLRKNEIEDFGEFEHLSGLKYLRVLWVDENPCTQNIDYRRNLFGIHKNGTNRWDEQERDTKTGRQERDDEGNYKHNCYLVQMLFERSFHPVLVYAEKHYAKIIFSESS